MFPNLGWSLKGPYPTITLFVVAPTLRPNGETFGKPSVPYPCPELPALDTIKTPGYSSANVPGIANEFMTKDNISRPDACLVFGKLETPQLFDIISALGVTVNFHLSSLFSNPADHNQAYATSPTHRALTGIISASGATPRIVNFFVLL